MIKENELENEQINLLTHSSPLRTVNGASTLPKAYMINTQPAQGYAATPISSINRDAVPAIPAFGLSYFGIHTYHPDWSFLAVLRPILTNKTYFI